MLKITWGILSQLYFGSNLASLSLWHSMEKDVSLDFVHYEVNKVSVKRTQMDIIVSHVTIT